MASLRMPMPWFLEPVNLNLTWRRAFAGVMKLRHLEWGDSSGLSRWAQCNHRDPCRRKTKVKKEIRDGESRGWSDGISGRGWWAKECKWLLVTGKIKEEHLPSPRASRRNAALLTCQLLLTSRLWDNNFVVSSLRKLIPLECKRDFQIGILLNGQDLF